VALALNAAGRRRTEMLKVLLDVHAVGRLPVIAVKSQRSQLDGNAPVILGCAKAHTMVHVHNAVLVLLR
jgi:hypothetical protein